MKLYAKRIICIVLAVFVLFFGVSNSYFSTTNMDKIEAASIAVPVIAIGIKEVVEILTVIGIGCLGYGIFENLENMDLMSTLTDFHGWAHDNPDELTDGSSALQTWAASDEWVVIEGTGGDQNPSPSPDAPSAEPEIPDNIINMPDSASLKSLSLATDATALKILSESVTPSKDIIDPVNKYLQHKAHNYATLPGNDPVASSFKEKYSYEIDSEIIYDGHYEKSGDNYIVRASTSRVLNGQLVTYTTDSNGLSIPGKVGAYDSGTAIVFLYYNSDTDNFLNPVISRNIYHTEKDGSITLSSTSVSKTGYFGYFGSYSTNVPVFSTSVELKSYLRGETDDSACLNKKNYIDTDDDYGWASTSNLRPEDLADPATGITNNLANKKISLQGLYNAVDALKDKLQENNPNIDPAVDPVPYPNVTTYPSYVQAVIDDPAVFPDDVPAVDPNPDSGTNTGTDTDEPNPSPSTSGNPSTDIDSNKSNLIVDLSKFFPFCIPFDLVHLITVLKAEPQAPYFEIPFNIPRLNFEYTFVIDFRQFESLAIICRRGELLLFILGLILITRGIIKG